MHREDRMHRLTAEDVDRLLSGVDSEARVLKVAGPVVLGPRVIVAEPGLYTMSGVPWSLAVTGSESTPGGPVAHLLED